MTQPVTVQRPKPIATSDTKGYWDSINRREFKIPKCNACGKWFYYPRIYCPYCLSEDWQLQTASGKGTVYSFSIVRHGFGPIWRNFVPYVPALVDLAEGARMTVNIVGCAPEEVKVDMAVQVDFLEVADGNLIPVFKPA